MGWRDCARTIIARNAPEWGCGDVSESIYLITAIPSEMAAGGRANDLSRWNESRRFSPKMGEWSGPISLPRVGSTPPSQSSNASLARKRMGWPWRRRSLGDLKMHL
jgi:hypothetical protein